MDRDITKFLDDNAIELMHAIESDRNSLKPNYDFCVDMKTMDELRLFVDSNLFLIKYKIFKRHDLASVGDFLELLDRIYNEQILFRYS